MRLTVAYDFLPKRPTVRASQVMDHFGVGFEQGRHVIADGLVLPVRPGDIVLFTGASGSGKSSLMRALGEALRSTNSRTEHNPQPPADLPTLGTTVDAPPADGVVVLDTLPLPDRLLVDALDRPAAEAMNLLSTCGLGEAHLMLRTPAELSDGQRYRFRLALALALQPQWVVADEFTATLDRTLAQVIAYNIRRLADRTGTGFLLATTHEDVAADLQPDLHVRCRLDGEVQVLLCEGRSESADAAGGDRESPAAAKEGTERRSDGEMEQCDTSVPSVHGSSSPLRPCTSSSPRSVPSSLPPSVSPPPLRPRCSAAGSAAAPSFRGRKKKVSPSTTTSGSPPRPAATGRTSLGGITAAITSDSRGNSRCCGMATSRSASACSSPRRSR